MEFTHPTDKQEFSRGMSRGDYASQYETEDYALAERALSGETGFYRAGFFLGFFSSYLLDEAPAQLQGELYRLRREFFPDECPNCSASLRSEQRCSDYRCRFYQCPADCEVAI